jgi:hypothetical protein
MPAGKRQQSNTMLYTVIVFVALFLVSTVFAVVFYIRSEDFRDREGKLQRELDGFIARSEKSRVQAIVGAKMQSQSYLGSMVAYHDQTVALVLGQPTDDSSVEIKTELSANRVREAIAKAQPFIEFEKVDPNSGLIAVVDKLVATLTTAAETHAALQEQIGAMQKELDSTVSTSQANNKLLEDEKNKYQAQAEEVLQRYEDLKLAWEQSGDDRAATIIERLEQERTTAQELQQNLLKTQAQLDITQGRMSDALDDLRKVAPAPSLEAITFTPDGRITLVNEAAGVVYISLGSNDRIYKGLTFSVYDKASAIPKDGKSKAEIEIFRVLDKSAAARIVSRDPRNPIATDDIIANLIWDRDMEHEFVIAGEFDLNDDGFMDNDAIERISGLIKQWGGRVVDTVSAETYVVLLGSMPLVPEKPSFDDLEVDPLAQDRYEAAMRRMETYQDINDSAKSLMIPMYKYEKFLYLIGYKGSVAKPGAFL